MAYLWSIIQALLGTVTATTCVGRATVGVRGGEGNWLRGLGSGVSQAARWELDICNPFTHLPTELLGQLYLHPLLLLGGRARSWTIKSLCS